VALILDVLGIGQRSGVLSEIREQSRTAAEQRTEFLAERKQRMLLFRTGSFERVAVPLSLVSRLEEFPRDSIEKAGDTQVVQYRGRILSLISLRHALCAEEHQESSAVEPLQVVVFHDGERSVGIVVDQILDVVEEVIDIKEKSNRKGLLGSTVLGGHVTDILDLNSILRSSGTDWFDDRGSESGKRVLVAARSQFLRGLIHCSLDMAGHRVSEAADLDEAIRILERQPVDMILADLDLSSKGGGELVSTVRTKPEWQKIPILGLTNPNGHGAASALGLREVADISDPEAILQSVARLGSEKPIALDVEALAGQER
jgi:two-component system, chemotaxis family, sensor kinase CheA